MSEKTYYDILGIKQSASSQEIKKAYHEMTRKYHPDRAKGDQEKEQASRKMEDINKAFITLSNKKKKEEYDSFLRSGYHNKTDFQTYQNTGGHFNNDPFSHFSQGGNEEFDNIRNIFDKFFNFNFSSGSSYSGSYGNQFGWSHKNNNTNHFKPTNSTIQISVTLEEMMQKKAKTVVYKRKKECKVCFTSYIKCKQCNNNPYRHNICKECLSTGYIREKTDCNQCSGIGYRLEQDKINIQINEKIVLYGAQCKNGGNFIHGKIGYTDLIIKFSILKHQIYNYDSEGNIYRTINIKLSDIAKAKNYIEVTLKYLDNANITFRIPKDNLEPIIINNKGINNSDLIIKIKVENDIEEYIKNVKSDYSNNTELKFEIK